MNLHLDHKLALVTASSGGIGKEIATSLAREGATVIINGRTAASVEAAISDIRTRVPGAKLEKLAADNGTAEGTTETLRQFPEVDILINNLGIYEAVGFFDETDADWQRLFEVNVLSGVRLARHYLKAQLAKKTGRVIFIASEAAISPSPEMAHYSATKTMQLSISRSLAELTKGTAVTVNTVMPGSTRTEGVAKFVQDLFPGLSLEEAEKRFMRENRPTSLIERLIDPKEVADFVTYVSSPLASAINGAALRIDGGLVRSVF
ncbi:SDR family NAD(P)-dependent oxidoreductase [Vitiosangium sp. GDMCC 1.1324]|uniref:SDR family NAD(P)-dependent oxidoreductase n=1 Tax=Vitiosangium sp. (strain GDMCC 1.1324) TaxID=2138576 RepID=UPI000D364C27|nr:SDR family oxidoreductase [Vitiosangium sp. GDMCC 1.1324]PTL85456.1 3-oxoacyl-ACP reductase [Vitiosangium sp. GDMCC 1.1324]